MPQPARFHVVVRFAGRIVDDRCCADALSLGDGGDVVVPGLGDVLELVRGDRLLPVDGLAGAVTTADALQPFESLEPAGMVMGEGDRAELRSIAHPELTVAIERISDERVRMRDRVALLPARETVFAAALAGCLATVLGGKVVIAALTEPEVEVDDDKTELELAMYEYAPVIPAWAFAAPVIYVEPEPEQETEPESLDAPVEVPDTVVGAADAPTPPLAMREREAEPRKRRARGRPERPVEIREARVLAMLGSTDSPVLFDVLSASNEELLSGIGEARIETPDAVMDIVELEGGGRGSVDSGVVGGTVARALPQLDELPRQVLPSPERPVQPVIEVGSADAPTDGEIGGPVALIVPPSPVDPRGGKFTLADALAGDDALAKGTGKLTAIIATNHGKITCELFEDRAPNTVANFVGLARGTRESLDHELRRWTKHRLYDGVTFHRVIDGFMIQGGDPTGTSTGGPGYEIADEIDPSLRHDRAGVLSMANKGPNTAGSQFFVTVAATAHLDGKHTVFGHCDPAVPSAIAKLPVDPRDNDRPRAAVVIETVKIVRLSEAVRDPLPGTEAPTEPAPSDTPPPAE